MNESLNGYTDPSEKRRREVEREVNRVVTWITVSAATIWTVAFVLGFIAGRSSI